MSLAAYVKEVRIGSDKIPFDTCSLSHEGDILDDTDMANNAGYRSKLYGLRDWTVSGSGNFTVGNAALVALRNAWLNRSAITPKYLPDGTIGNGFEGAAKVEKFELAGDVGGKETFSVTIVGSGALGAAT